MVPTPGIASVIIQPANAMTTAMANMIADLAMMSG